MPSCRQVNRSLADFIDGGPADGGEGPARVLRSMVEAHLRVCGACAAEAAAMTRIAAEVAAAGAVAPGSAVTGSGFEQRVLAAARARRASGAADDTVPRFRPPARANRYALRRPTPLQAAAALAIMVLAGVLAVFYGGFDPESPAVARHETGTWDEDLLESDGRLSAYDDAAGFAGDDRDRLVPVREVPFSLRQDLVGVRSGRIPATTYVLEPAPDDSAVMRASF